MAKQIELTKRVLDFSQRPGPRLKEQGKHSGEEFYDSSLNEWFKEALSSDRTLVVILDGTDGYLTSFIDEAFGRLVYDYGLSKVKNNLKIISNFEPEWLSRLESRTFPIWEERRRNGEAPKHTLAIN